MVSGISWNYRDELFHRSRERPTKGGDSHARIARQARRARQFGGRWAEFESQGTGSKKKGASPQQQVRRHRSCEVERPLHDPGAKKENRNEF